MRNSSILLIGIVAAGSVATTTTSDWSSTGCIAPSEFESCITEAESTYSNCSTTSDCSLDDVPCMGNTCLCELNAAKINCALESCWNRPYTCEYQTAMLNVVQYCDSADPTNLPYFDVPDDAAGACSCDLAKLFEQIDGPVANSVYYTLQLFNETVQGLNESQLTANETEFVCCGMSGAISSMYETCPNTNPSTLEPLFSPILSLIEPTDFEFSFCTDALKNINCTEVLDLYYLPDNGTYYPTTYYNADDLPTSGTQSLTDSSGSLTSPLSGATITWSAQMNTTWTITATTADASVTGSSATTTGGSGSASATSTSGAEKPNTRVAGCIAGLIGVLAIMVTF